MDYGLYLSAAGAIVQDARVDTISHNLANVNTVGFRRILTTVQARQVASREDPGSRWDSFPLHDRIGGGLHLAQEEEHIQPGTIARTGRNLDLAINGEGYFTVQDPESKEIFYTRAGNFLTDAQGRLTTADGNYKVLGQGETALNIIDSAQENVSGRVLIRTFAPDAQRERIGKNLYRIQNEPIELEATGLVHSRAIEKSSVNVVSEMIEMIKALRAYQGNMQAVRNHDSTLGRAVNDIARAVR